MVAVVLLVGAGVERLEVGPSLDGLWKVPYGLRAVTHQLCSHPGEDGRRIHSHSGVERGLDGIWVRIHHSCGQQRRWDSLGGGKGTHLASLWSRPSRSVCLLQTYSLLLDVEDYERRYLLSLEGERPALMGERKQKICDMYDNLRGKAPGQDRSVEVVSVAWLWALPKLFQGSFSQGTLRKGRNLLSSPGRAMTTSCRSCASGKGSAS